MLKAKLAAFVNLRELIAFAVVGVGATLTHYFVALGATELTAISLYWANLCGYLTALSVSYFGHSMVTFQTKMTANRALRFAVTSVSAFLLSQGILWALQIYLNASAKIDFLVVVIFIPIYSFLLSKLWVFR